MKLTIRQNFVCAFGLVFLMALLAACGTGPSTSTTTGSLAAATQVPTPTPSPTPKPTIPLKQYSATGFTISYPTGWHTSQTSLKWTPSGGPGAMPQHTEMDYAFVAGDNLTGLHIARDTDEQAVGGMTNRLLGGVFVCHAGDASIPNKVKVGGVMWSQADIVCMVASSFYELRELVYSNPQTNVQTVILYGAYQQVGNGAAAPDFAHTSQKYFEPMLASFDFK